MIRFDNLSFTYSGADHPTLRNVNLEIPEGELCVVVGQTGTGKSTLLRAINGLVPHFSGGNLSGSVTVEGRSTRDHRPRDLADVVGYVGQNPVAGFVTERVEDELAYTMENLGVPPDAMRRPASRTPSICSVSRTCANGHCARCRAASSNAWPSAQCSRPRRASSCSTSPRPPSIRPQPRRCSAHSPGSCTTSA